MECGATCLRMVAHHYGKMYSAEAMRQLCAVGHSGISMLSLNEAAIKIGFRTVCGRMSVEKLVEQRPCPCILHWNQEHFVVLYKVERTRKGELKFCISDPGKYLLTLNEETFRKLRTSSDIPLEAKGIVMALQPTPIFYSLKGEMGAEYSMSFLWSYLKSYKGLFGQLIVGLAIGSVLQLTQADLFHTNIASTKLQQTQEGGSLFINEIKNIIITIVAATAVIEGQLTLGMMLSIQYIIGQLNAPIEQFVHFIYSWQDVQLSIERISEVRQKEDENVRRAFTNPECSKEDIELKNVTFQYNGSHSLKVLEDICLRIPNGKVTAIVGASGSGKTTLLKLLLGFYSPIAGDILIGHQNINEINLQFWRSLCGVVMQDGYIFSESIARNIALDDNDIDYERMLLAARIANITEMIEQLPLKYDTVIGANGQGVSQGQRQRILIARAVYKNPAFLFFDEATNSLDSSNEKQIVNNLQDFYEGKTTIIVAHRLSTVKHADQIVVLEKGRVAETGIHSELVDKKGAYYNLIKNQLELSK